jgi:hypothetical protein
MGLNELTRGILDTIDDVEKSQPDDSIESVAFVSSCIYYCIADYTDDISGIWKSVVSSNDVG